VAVGCANGQKLKYLTDVDEFSKESLFIDVAGSIRRQRLIELLEKLINKRGCPFVIRIDNGPQFVSLALLKWAIEKGLRNFLIEPGKPWQNRTNQSFNGKLRGECSAMNWFNSRTHSKVIMEA
jgi:putative transposase